MHSLVDEISEELQAENAQLKRGVKKKNTANSSGHLTSLDLESVADVSGTRRLNPQCRLSRDKGGGRKDFFFIEHSL